MVGVGGGGCVAVDAAARRCRRRACHSHFALRARYHTSMVAVRAMVRAVRLRSSRRGSRFALVRPMSGVLYRLWGGVDMKGHRAIAENLDASLALSPAALVIAIEDEQPLRESFARIGSTPVATIHGRNEVARALGARLHYGLGAYWAGHAAGAAATN